MDIAPLEAIRKRPGMYIGDTHDGSGLRHMVWEVVANSLDEYLAGRCIRIDIEIAADGSIVVEDDGRGFPVHDVDGVPFAERALTSFHSTPTRDGHAPHEHVGLQGVGVFAVCALSTWLALDVFREGSHFAQRFERGLAVSPLRVMGRTTRTGTRVAFAPDPSIFTSTSIDPGPVLTRLREMSFLLPELNLSFADRREHRWHEPRGLVAYVESKTRYDSDRATIFSASRTTGAILVEVAARWGAVPWSSIESFANVHATTDGGTHVRGFLLGLAAGLRAVAADACVGRTAKRIEATVLSGVTAIISVRLNDPTYGEPTRTRLVTPEAQAAVKVCVAEAFAEFLLGQPALRARLVSSLQEAG